MFTVVCNDNGINAQQNVKYLGQVIDSDLSGDSTANDVIKKVNSRLKFLYRQKDVLDIQLRKTLCNSLVQCIFDYSCSSWYYGVSARLKTRLQTCQNKVVRFIYDYSPRTSLRDSDFANLGMLRVEDRVKQLGLNHAHKIFYNKCPSYLHDNFQKLSSVHGYETRGSAHNFYVKKRTTN